MNCEPLIMVCTCEMAGRVRGKGFPLKDLPERLSKGVGWVPTNSMISCFGAIGDTPFGATGDLILVPDPETEVRVRYDDESAPEHFYLGDIRETDGTPWSCCPRDFLRRGLAALERGRGLIACSRPSSRSSSIPGWKSCRVRPTAWMPIAARESSARPSPPLFASPA